MKQRMPTANPLREMVTVLYGLGTSPTSDIGPPARSRGTQTKAACWMTTAKTAIIHSRGEGGTYPPASGSAVLREDGLSRPVDAPRSPMNARRSFARSAPSRLNPATVRACSLSSAVHRVVVRSRPTSAAGCVSAPDLHDSAAALEI